MFFHLGALRACACEPAGWVHSAGVGVDGIDGLDCLDLPRGLGTAVSGKVRTRFTRMVSGVRKREKRGKEKKRTRRGSEDDPIIDQ